MNETELQDEIEFDEHGILLLNKFETGDPEQLKRRNEQLKMYQDHLESLQYRQSN